MFVTRKTKLQIFVYGILAIFCLAISPALFAQQDFLFEDDSLNTFEEEVFIDDMDLNELQLESDFEQDFNSNRVQEDQYLDEDIVPDETQELLQESLIQRRDFLAEEKANFVPNILYGVGTGLIIGGWLAFLTANNSRETFRSIGMGVVLGGLMGSVLGSRSIITPNAPIPNASLPQKKPFNTQNQGMTVSLQWKF